MSRGLASGIDLVFESATATMTPEVARWLSEFRASPRLEARLEDFAERNTEGQLSDEELQEYSALVELGDIFSILRQRARKFLADQSGASSIPRNGRPLRNAPLIGVNTASSLAPNAVGPFT